MGGHWQNWADVEEDEEGKKMAEHQIWVEIPDKLSMLSIYFKISPDERYGANCHVKGESGKIVS